MEPQKRLPKPAWIKARLPAGDEWKKVDDILARNRLSTVCDEAHCPNKGECWGCGTATFMVLGDICTRGCRFCAVATAKDGRPLRADEPEALAAAVDEMGLSYAVITSVDRDDLPDRGAAHFARCVTAIRERSPSVRIEVLIPDYIDGELDILAASAPDVLAHNVETVRRLQRVRDARASFDRSLLTLRQAREKGIAATKSSILLGLGETREELLATYEELRGAGGDGRERGPALGVRPRGGAFAVGEEPEADDVVGADALAVEADVALVLPPGGAALGAVGALAVQQAEVAVGAVVVLLLDAEQREAGGDAEQGAQGAQHAAPEARDEAIHHQGRHEQQRDEIGRASCRERV